MQHTQTLKDAQNVLLTNWREGFTIPTDGLYPFQWNWDSGFISLGYAHFDISKALQELKTLFSAQWANGMLPHIIFHDENQETYFPNHDFWESSVNPGAPTNLKTSGITQPPVHGFILEHLWKQHKDNDDVCDFAKFLFPKVVALHRYFYEQRDPNREGLCYIYHPWESGRDNSPIWDYALRNIDLNPDEIPRYKRRDLSEAPADERPTSAEYDRYVYLVLLGKKFKYEGAGIAQESPFLIQDTLMNALLIKSNEALINLGKAFGFDTAELQEWQNQSTASFKEKLWNQQGGYFTGYDLRHQKQLDYYEIGSFMSLFAGLSSNSQAKDQNDYLKKLHDSGYYICPSFDINSDLFDAKRYWRGPVWPHMNWMIRQGLIDYGYHDTAELIKSDTLSLIESQGFYEYFNALKSANASRGHGGDCFSWSASTIIDLILN